MAAETGGPNAPGTTLNLPFPAGTRGDVYRRAFDEVVLPVPELSEKSSMDLEVSCAEPGGHVEVFRGD